MAKYELNDSLNGVVIYFDGIPSVAIRDEVKAAGFRWNGAKKCWYAKQTEERIELAKKMAGQDNRSRQSVSESTPIQAEAIAYIEPPIIRRYCYASSLITLKRMKKSRIRWI